MGRILKAAVLSVLLAAGWPQGRGFAASTYRACSLLTTAEVEAALRGRVTGSNERDAVVSTGPYRGETISGCTWIVGSAYLSVSVVRRKPAGEPEQAAAVRTLRRALDDLRRKRWTIAPADVAGAECHVAQPPARDRRVGPVVACFMERRGFAFGLYAVRTRLAAEQVKALGDLVAGRLP
ncbi:MAG: hypothetical protein QN141_12310 [Armatimonadota bacterium]|nr:hypothetical protein [Armatimonadota bacterium]MDR7452616.1 hypothetical protein [Armatimonadota bacterium]MDR7467815.1 hypothetical protein [Armatimonadota bacterium]MDR7494599.1 hypothetical protein [Armatimonadota bacterium]MDR7499659.1 hypothetical protein [Armatimonadota bacterium]